VFSKFFSPRYKKRQLNSNPPPLDDEGSVLPLYCHPRPGGEFTVVKKTLKFIIMNNKSKSTIFKTANIGWYLP
jgi:hypothetical protein